MYTRPEIEAERKTEEPEGKRRRSMIPKKRDNRKKRTEDTLEDKRAIENKRGTRGQEKRLQNQEDDIDKTCATRPICKKYIYIKEKNERKKRDSINETCSSFPELYTLKND